MAVRMFLQPLVIACRRFRAFCSDVRSQGSAESSSHPHVRSEQMCYPEPRRSQLLAI